MRIGVIGSGNIGGTAAGLFEAVGHDVMIGSRSGPDSPEDAARHGEVVLVAIPFFAIDALPVDALAGKMVVDANNYYPGRDGQVPALDADETTSSELLAAQLPGARVVKAFNTMNYVPLGERGDPSLPRDQRLAIYLAGDDAVAKGVVSGLIEELGYAAVDAGGLADGGRRLQPGSPVYGTDLTPPEAGKLLGA
ncbi:MAG: NADP oxidoreductase [Solirubrobacteraceae bacterium]